MLIYFGAGTNLSIYGISSGKWAATPQKGILNFCKALALIHYNSSFLLFTKPSACSKRVQSKPKLLN